MSCRGPSRPKKKKATRQVMKRPAQKQNPPELPDWPGEPELPAWPEHAVSTLMEFMMMIKNRLGAELNVNLWSDCGGMTLEAIGLKKLATTLFKVTGVQMIVVPFIFCDKCPTARQFEMQNHDAKHISDDMAFRDFEKGTFLCSKCDDEHPMPKAGIDIYVCCFPCGPWSARGKGCGLDDKNGGVVWMAIKTIKFCMPAAWMMENVMRIDQVQKSDLQKIVDVINKVLGAWYVVVIVKGIDPLIAGFPTHKGRLIILGGRRDLFCQFGLSRAVELLMASRLPIQYNYRQLIGCQELTINWELAWRPIGARDQHVLLSSPCSCKLDPFQLCSAHPCKCKKCNGTDTTCAWRQTHKQFMTKMLASHGVPIGDVVQWFNDKMTYVALIELMGYPGPKSCRERNMLNIMSLLPDVQPMGHMPAIFDISQTIGFDSLHCDGSVGTMATSSVLWSIPDARALTCLEMAKLMGHDENTNFSGLSDPQVRKLLGMSLHVGTAGLMMSCVLAGLGHGP